MKQLTGLLLTLMLTLTAAATEITFVKNLTWKQIKEKAAKEKKMIFFDAYTSWCGPCKYLETSVYTDANVASYYNSNFINVKFDMEKGEGINLAEEFGITAYPTLLFFTAEGNLIHKNVGALQVPDFIALGKDAGNPDKQYFTLKQKVLDKKASREDFLKWTKMADDIEDVSRGGIAADWLSGQADILATAELAKSAMLADVNEVQLAYLYKEKKRIQELLKWDADKTAAKLYHKTFNLALKEFDNKAGAVIKFTNVIRKFDPARVNYALKELHLTVALNLDNDNAKAIAVITGSLKGKERLTLKETADLLLDYVPRFEEADMQQLKKGLDAYTFTGTDKSQECWMYLMQVICYSRIGENSKAKLFAQKAYKHAGLTQEYKNLLKESFGLAG